MQPLAQDLRYALRGFFRSPGFTAAALVSLAIGIGANTAIFSVANALLLRPLPYRDPGRLVILWNRSPGLAITQDWFSTAQYFDIRNDHHGFEQLAIAIGGKYTLTRDGEPERIGVARASSSLLPLLGGRALLGRLLSPDDDAAGQAPSAILTYDFWQRRYGGDRRMVGKAVILDGVSYPVVGILPRGFRLPHQILPILTGPDQVEIVVSLPMPTGAAQIRTREDYTILGRLRRGVPLTQAQAEMDALTARLRRDYPDLYPPNGGLTFSIVPLLDQVVGDTRGPLVVLLAAVGFVLLIACANVANLSLSRAVGRQKEIAVRAALGAGRSRIVRQLLTESLLLAAGGGALGVLFAGWGVHWIQALGTRSVPRLHEISIDPRVLVFTLGLSLGSGIIFGLAPALRVSSVALSGALGDASRGSSGGSLWGRGNRLRRLLVVAELALSVVMLIGAGLLIRSFARLNQVPPGFNPSGVLTFDLAMAGRKYNNGDAVLAAYRQLWERFERLPGVTAAGGITSLPFTDQFAWTPITIEGRVPPPGEKFLNADARIAGGRYFEAMEIPLVAGRFFDQQDTADKPRVTIIDERMAREYWPGQSAVGKRIQVVQLRGDPWLTIVGVVGRVKQDSLDADPRIAFYRPQTQAPSRAMTVAVRSGADPLALAGAVKREIRDLDGDLPMYAVRSMQQLLAQSLAPRRFLESLLTLFAGLALVLAALGIYGVMAYQVSQGTRELGIRIALGATRRAIVRMVLGRGMTLAVCGVAIGMAAAVALTRLMRGLLFGVDALDAVSFASTAVLLALVGGLACYIPARRAAHTDPLTSLRSE
ncbi:MAG TPA: ABC transporter permease [Bryobacteraceae bacterium]|nr:ABC transporter permease [Bryobacteraceae bacterium]